MSKNFTKVMSVKREDCWSAFCCCCCKSVDCDLLYTYVNGENSQGNASKEESYVACLPRPGSLVPQKIRKELFEMDVHIPILLLR